MRRRIVGVDPGLASFGLAVIEGNAVRLVVIRTIKGGGHWAAQDMADRIRRLTLEAAPLVTGADVLVSEAMSYPRSASSSAKLAAGWAVALSLAAISGVETHVVSPQYVRENTAGRRTGKDDVRRWLERRYGLLEATTPNGGKVPAAQHHHAWDALAAAHVWRAGAE